MSNEETAKALIGSKISNDSLFRDPCRTGWQINEIVDLAALRDAFRELENKLWPLEPNSQRILHLNRENSIVKTKLQEAYNWAIMSINYFYDKVKNE
jgi:hypothetical protein